MKVIFLDIDGVLNGHNWVNLFIGNVCCKIKPLKVLWDKWDLFGIRSRYVRNLAKIVHATNAKIVISSSWKHAWYTPYLNCEKRMKSLKDKFTIYDIDVIGTTPTCEGSRREDEIRKWLNQTDYTVENYVILDDEPSDLQSFIGNHLVKTSSIQDNEIIQGLPRENTGLTMRRARKAIQILNKKGC